MAVNLVRGTAVPCCRTKVAGPQAVSHHLLPRALRCPTPVTTHAAKVKSRCVIVEASKGFGLAKPDAPALLLPSCPCQSGKAYKVNACILHRMHGRGQPLAVPKGAGR